MMGGAGAGPARFASHGRWRWGRAIDAVAFDGIGHDFSRDQALRREGCEGRDHNRAAVHLEEGAERLARVVAAKTVHPKRSEAGLQTSGNHMWMGSNVVTLR